MNHQYLYGNRAGQWALLEFPEGLGVPPPTLQFRDADLPMLGTPSDIMTRLVVHCTRGRAPVQRVLSQLLGVAQATVSTCINGGGRLRLASNDVWLTLIKLYYRPAILQEAVGRVTASSRRRGGQ